MPRPDGTTRLPTDLPPSNRQVRPFGGGANMAGIHTTGSAGEVAVPFPTVPWNPWESQSFPAVEGSMAAANLSRAPSVRPAPPGSAESVNARLAPGSPWPIRAGDPDANALRPRWVVSVNSYSPVAHRNPLSVAVPPRAMSARGVAVPTQRPRGFAPGFSTLWPPAAPRWPSFREAARAASG
jgi:hypothetical protein